MDTKAIIKDLPGTLARGAGQVMFQDNAWTGILFFAGILWGSIASHNISVFIGAFVGLLVSTLTGYLIGLKDERGSQGLWGFNGILVGVAFPTFLGNTVWMWLALILCAAMTTWVRNALDTFFKTFGVTSYTFPFVVCTWLFLLAARQLNGIPHPGLPEAELPYGIHDTVNLVSWDIFVYWLKGISQVFLINNWVTGLFFLAALAVSSRRAAGWAALSSAVALLVAIFTKAPGMPVENGLYGFSAVLTGIAIGATFTVPSLKTTVWAIIGVIATVYVQAGMNTLVVPFGIPTLTGPFCVATWFMMMPHYGWFTDPKKSAMP